MQLDVVVSPPAFWRDLIGIVSNKLGLFSHLHDFLSNNFMSSVIFGQVTDIQTDIQNTMHMSPPCIRTDGLKNVRDRLPVSSANSNYSKKITFIACLWKRLVKRIPVFQLQQEPMHKFPCYSQQRVSHQILPYTDPLETGCSVFVADPIYWNCVLV